MIIPLLVAAFVLIGGRTLLLKKGSIGRHCRCRRAENRVGIARLQWKTINRRCKERGIDCLGSGGFCDEWRVGMDWKCKQN